MFLKNKNRKTLTRSAIILAVIAITFLIDSAMAQAFLHLKEGDVAPSFKLQTVGGELVEYSAPPGVAVVLSFVRMGQDKSTDVLRELARLDAKLGEKTQVLALVTNPGEGNVAEWAKGLGITFPVLLDKNEEIYSKFGVMVSPQTAIITPEGKLKFEISGHTADFKPTLEGMLREILGMPALEDKSVAVAKDLPPERQKALRELQKATVLIKRKMKSKAVAQAKMATEADDTYLDAHLMVADLLFDEGGAANAAEIEKHLTRGSQLDPNATGVKVGMARLKALKGDYAGAVATLEETAKISPKSGKLYYILGRIHQDAGKLEEAAKAFRTAFEKTTEGPDN